MSNVDLIHYHIFIQITPKQQKWPLFSPDSETDCVKSCLHLLWKWQPTEHRCICLVDVPCQCNKVYSCRHALWEFLSAASMLVLPFFGCEKHWSGNCLWDLSKPCGFYLQALLKWGGTLATQERHTKWSIWTKGIAKKVQGMQCHQ